MISGVFHFNLNVSDIDRSTNFYKALGFTVVDDMTVEFPHLGVPLGLVASKLRTVFLKLGNEAGAPMLDLVQFIVPEPSGHPYDDMTNVGIGRIAFKTADMDQLLVRVDELGTSLAGPEITFRGPGGHLMRSICFRDPDGIMLQAFSEKEAEVPA